MDLHQLFLDKILKNGSTDNNFDVGESDSIVAHISRELRQTFPSDHFLAALQKLDDLRVIDIPETEDGIIRFDVALLLQAVYIEAELQDGNQ